jgi:SAM-dependent methyltransferase
MCDKPGGRKMTLNVPLFETIDTTISPKDGMYQGNKDHYFYVGYSGMTCINNALMMTGKDPHTIRTVLDLPSGYGRVLRWISAAFPESEITACDLDFDAVDFCSDHLGAKKLYSDRDPEKIRCEGTFDLIWCGSLFTHLDSSAWKKFFRFFDRILNPDGILVFTTHGPFVIIRAKNGFDYGLLPHQLDLITRQFTDSGFGYENYHTSTDYGISVARPSFTLKLLEENTDLRLIFYQEKGWDHHQDVIGCFKDSQFKEKEFYYTSEFNKLFGR